MLDFFRGTIRKTRIWTSKVRIQQRPIKPSNNAPQTPIKPNLIFSCTYILVLVIYLLIPPDSFTMCIEISICIYNKHIYIILTVNVFKKRVIIQSMHHTVFIHLYTHSFLSFSHSLNRGKKMTTFFFGRTEINLTEQKGEKKIFFC